MSRTATVELGRRVVHHDHNVGRLPGRFEKYGPTAAVADHSGGECLLALGSQLPARSTHSLIAESGIQTMRHNLAPARCDRLRALDGTYPTTR